MYEGNIWWVDQVSEHVLKWCGHKERMSEEMLTKMICLSEERLREQSFALGLNMQEGAKHALVGNWSIVVIKGAMCF